MKDDLKAFPTLSQISCILKIFQPLQTSLLLGLMRAFPMSPDNFRTIKFSEHFSKPEQVMRTRFPNNYNSKQLNYASKCVYFILNIYIVFIPLGNIFTKQSIIFHFQTIFPNKTSTQQPITRTKSQISKVTFVLQQNTSLDKWQITIAFTYNTIYIISNAKHS